MKVAVHHDDQQPDIDPDPEPQEPDERGTLNVQRRIPGKEIALEVKKA